jgi:hypothetical protein
MKRSLKGILDYKVETLDGKSGSTKDFLFDQKLWVVRFVKVDFGSLFTSERKLIPRVFLKTPQWQEKKFTVELNEDEIGKCPDIADHLPVSRKVEEQLFGYYGIDPYWTTPYPGHMTMYHPPRPVIPPAAPDPEEEVDTELRSFSEIEHYHINALDGKLGHIEDLVIDDEEWQVLYAIVDTSNWLPWSKKVMISIDFLDQISYTDGEVSINLKKDTIKSAPEFDPSVPIDEEYEKKVFDFYSRSLVK